MKNIKEAAPKRWSKYTTLLNYIQILKSYFRITERSISSGLMVPEQSSLRRHSTGNSAVSPAALKSLRDAAAAAEDVKNKLSDQRRPSYSRLPVQPQQSQQQQQQQQQIQQQPQVINIVNLAKKNSLHF